jgi:hypothetical protein
MSDGLGDAKAQVKLQDFSNIFRLDGKVAVVTGGSRGLGLHAASGSVPSLSRLIKIPILILTRTDSSKLAAQKSSSHPAKQLPARKLAPL